MGTTSRGAPYPDPEDFLANTAAAVRALAEWVNDAVGGALFRATITAENVAGDNTWDVLDINMTAGDSALFTDLGNSIEYTGPRCIAVLVGYVEFAASGAGTRSVELRVNGAKVARRREVPVDGTEVHPMNPVWPVILDPGDTLSIAARQNTGGALQVDGAYRCIVLGV